MSSQSLAHRTGAASSARWASLSGARLVYGLAVACTVVATLVLSSQFVLSAISSVGLAWPITHPEGATVAAMMRVRDGQALYQNFHQYPHLITPYPPLQAVVVGLTSRVLGLAVLETVTLSRGLTLAASLIATVLIWLIARRLGAGRLAALAAAGLLLPQPSLDEWGFASRPDVPAIALSLGAMLLLIIRPRHAWLAAIVAVAACFTKQTAVAFPAAATIWLVATGRWKAATIFVATWIGLAAVTMAVLEAVTGRMYVLNTVLAHVNTPKNGFDLAIRDSVPLFADGWLPLGLSLLALLVPGVRGRALLPALYLGTATALAFYSMRNTGGDVNYLIEPAAAACIPAALAIDWLWHSARRSRQAPLTPPPPVPSPGAGPLGVHEPFATHRAGWGLSAAPPPRVAPSPRQAGEGEVATGLPLSRAWGRRPEGGGLVAAVILAIAAVVWAAGLWDFWRFDGGIDASGRLPLAEIAAAENVLSEEPLAVLLAGQPLVVSDTFHLSMLTTSGYFDEIELERRIKRGEFDLIVMRSDIRAARWWKRQLLLPELIRLAIKDTYVPAGRVGIFWLYRPEERRGSGR